MSDEQPGRQDDDEGGTGAQRDPESDRRTGDAGTAPAAQAREGGSDTTA